MNRQYRRVLLVGFMLIIAAGTLWLARPTDSTADAARFQREAPTYRSAARDLAANRQPACLASHACLPDGQRLIFPWDGMLAGWSGVVFDPYDNMQEFMNRQPGFTAQVVGCKRLEPFFYLCGFG